MSTVRPFIIVISMLVLTSLPAFAQEVDFKVFPELAGATFNHVSSNGRYAVGYVMESVGFVYDVETEQLTVVEGPEGAIENNVSKQVCEVQDISDNGIICGNFLSPDAIVKYVDAEGSPILDESGKQLCSSALVPGVYKEGKWTALERHDDLVNLVGSGADGGATGITADGSRITGMVQIKKTGTDSEWGQRYVTCVWNAVDGKILQEYDGCTVGQGGRAWSISDDGTVLCGWTENDNYNRGPAIWNNGEYIKIGAMGDSQAMSPNGLYVGGQMDGQPFIWKKETQEVTICPIHEGMAGGVVTGLSNDGMAAGYSYSAGFPQDRLPFVITNEGNFYDLIDYLEKEYGYSFPEGTTELFTAMDISGDGSVICGWNALREPWVLKIKPNAITSVRGEGKVEFYVEGKQLKIISVKMENAKAEVINLAGSPVLLTTFRNGAASLESLERGIYLVRVHTGEETFTGKIVLR